MTSLSIERRDVLAAIETLPLSRWLLALVTAGLSTDEALSIISRVQRDQINSERLAA
jgi:hypothetical protein